MQSHTIDFVDKISESEEAQMEKDLVAYESTHGIDVNYKKFALVLRDKQVGVFGVLDAYTAFAEIHVDDIWIDARYRRQGFGKMLLQTLEQKFRGKGFNNINLVTNAFQAPEFYKKCGFQAEFTRINKKNPKLNKTFFVKFFDEENQTQGLMKSN